MGRPQRDARHRRGAVPDPQRAGPDLTSAAGGDPALPDGTRRSPNIWDHPATYELENHAADPDGRIEQLIRRRHDWADRDVLDVGCGTGFHLPRFAGSARSVAGVEPNPALVAIARRRVRSLANVTVSQGSATRLPLPAASVDLVHARWAYFFGPGCEPGLAELDRVVRPGAAAYVIDNDPTTSTFGTWFRQGYPSHDAAAVERFWAESGWSRHRLEIGWAFEDRADLEAVVRLELPQAAADAALASYEGTRVDYAVNVWVKEF